MCIDSHLESYVEVKSRQQKSKIVTSIVQNIRKAASESGGGFVRKDLLTRRWFKVDDKLAREKVGQALRDAIKTKRAALNNNANVIAAFDKKPPAAAASFMADKVISGNSNVNSGDVMSMPLSSSIIQNADGAGGAGGLYNTSFAEEKQLQQLKREQERLSSSSATSSHVQRQPVVQFSQPAPAPLFFDNRLSAELEPTPITHPSSNQNQALTSSTMFPSLSSNAINNDDNANSHGRSSLSASTLLRLYDTGNLLGRQGLSSNPLDNTTTTVSAAAPLSSTLNIHQHMLPTTIQASRRLSDAIGPSDVSSSYVQGINMGSWNLPSQLLFPTSSLSATSNELKTCEPTESNDSQRPPLTASSSTTMADQQDYNFTSGGNLPYNG